MYRFAVYVFVLPLLCLGTLVAVGFSSENGSDRTLSILPPVARGEKRFAVQDRTWPEKVGEAQICLWKDDRMAAVTITVDDNTVPDHPWWLAKADDVGFKITWFVVSGAVSDRGGYFGKWDDFKNILAAGHDVQSHTQSHLDDKKPELGVEEDYALGVREIEKNLPGHKIRALAYPGGSKTKQNDPGLAAKYYAVSRGVVGVMNGADTVDYTQTNSIGGLFLDEKLPNGRDHWANLRFLLDKANKQYYRGWYCAHFHNVKDEAKPLLEPAFAFLKANRDSLWMGPFAEVGRYAQERDTARLTVKENGNHRIVLNLTDRMRDDWFDVPLTVKARIPDAWRNVTARQAGQELPLRRIEHDGKTYALVDVIPDRGEAVLTSTPAPISTATTLKVAEQRKPLESMPEQSEKLISSITSNDITWHFAGKHEAGQFINGDYWVVGPVTITAITNTLNDPTFTPRKGQNGSMVNPLPVSKAQMGRFQGRVVGTTGYDDGHKESYQEHLNAALPNGKPLSSDNPLTLKTGQTLVSAVSWLYRDKDVREPGCPGLYATGTPRPALRSAGFLTCLDQAPPTDAFRPPYCGDKKPLYRAGRLRHDLLKKLPPPVAVQPNIPDLAKKVRRSWLDHLPGWEGEILHPTDNMPSYGRELNRLAIEVALALHLDTDQLPGKPDKAPILIPYVQYGIDLAGIVDNGGYFPADGGHGAGRKWPILFAGLMLDEPEMKRIGQKNVRFQEDEQTFFVTKESVALSHGEGWKPDRRAPVIRYENRHIGLPEWGIAHAKRPECDNYGWDATYRGINNAYLPGYALAALIMDAKSLWNHDPLFAYCDLVMEVEEEFKNSVNFLPRFPYEMWRTYREKIGDPPNVYSRPAGTPVPQPTP